MSVQDEADAAISAFYAAATGQGEWETALDHLLAATGFDGAAFYVVDRATRSPLAMRWHRLDTSCAREYETDYVPCDPRAAQVFVPEPTRILYDYLHTAESEIDRDPFYDWFQRTQHQRYYLGGQSRAGASLPLTLTLHRPRSGGHVEQSEAHLFGQLFDHFENAVLLEQHLALDAKQAAIRLADREADIHGMVLLDGALHVLHANVAARRMAARGDGIMLSSEAFAGEALGAHSGAGASRLAAMLAAAAGGRVTKAMQLERPFGGLPYVLKAWPTGGRDLLAGRQSVAVAVRILDPDMRDDRGVAEAAELLGLTRQETAIVALLVEGADPVEIAARLALQPPTVRTYLGAIYRKTGCNRQAALVARVLSLARTLDRG